MVVKKITAATGKTILQRESLLVDTTFATRRVALSNAVLPPHHCPVPQCMCVCVCAGVGRGGGVLPTSQTASALHVSLIIPCLKLVWKQMLLMNIKVFHAATILHVMSSYASQDYYVMFRSIAFC